MDASYNRLQCALQALDRDSCEFQMAEQYCLNQKASYALRVVDVFKVARSGERERFQGGMHNRQLLWHGSRTTNYVGILSQGLRIAPPEAPCSGYRFGKGIYLADVCEKSASYCRSSGSDTILMMLCEAALGTPAELTRDKYMEKPEAGFNSTKALGGVAPDPAATIKMEGTARSCWVMALPLLLMVCVCRGRAGAPGQAREHGHPLRLHPQRVHCVRCVAGGHSIPAAHPNRLTCACACLGALHNPAQNKTAPASMQNRAPADHWQQLAAAIDAGAVDADAAIARETNADWAFLQSEVAAMRELFGDARMAVHAQAPDLGEAETNTACADVQADRGVHNVNQARKLSRHCCCCPVC